MSHPIEQALRPGETLAELVRAVQYGEIAWPQWYEVGERIVIDEDCTEDK